MRLPRIARYATAVAACLGITALATLAPAQPARANVTIQVCYLAVNYPHGSTHVSGTINTVSTINCSIAVPELYLKTYLMKSNGSTWAGNTASRLNTSSVQSNAATSCTQGPGSFRNHAYYQVVFPPGYQPLTYQGWHDSPWISVACGVADMIAAQASGVPTAPTEDVIPIEVTPPSQ